MGSVGDAYDNAMAESVIGLNKTEVIKKRGPWKNHQGREFATLTQVDWFNNRRHLEPIRYIPPVELEQMYYQDQESVLWHTTTRRCWVRAKTHTPEN